MDIIAHRNETAVVVRERWGGLLRRIDATTAERDRHQQAVSTDLLLEIGTSGLQAFALPSELGGENVSDLTWGLVLEQIGYLCADNGVPMIINHSLDTARLIWESGRTDLINRYARPIADGTCIAGIAYTEDADAFSFKTTLRRKGSDYVLDGYKSYAISGAIHNLMLTYALDEAGDMIALLVERDDPGVSVTPADAMGMYTAGCSSITYSNTPIPAWRILAHSDGLAHSQNFLNMQRLRISCAPLGRAQAILEHCTHHTLHSIRYGEPVSDLKNVQATLGRMYIGLEAARATLYYALGEVDAGRTDKVFDLAISVAKHFVTEQIRNVVNDASRILGGHGYYGITDIGRNMRDFTGVSVATGTQDILETNIGAGVIARRNQPFFTPEKQRSEWSQM